jgi:hypothetical protein
MKKVYNYSLKHTVARTQYVEISDEDTADIINYMIQISARINELDTQHDEDWRMIREQYFHRRRNDLPKSQYGPNSPASFIGGMINNLAYGTQRDLTQRQLEGLETVTAQIAQVWEDIPAMVFRISLFAKE